MIRLGRSSLFCCADQGTLCSVCRCSTLRLVFVCTPKNRFDEILFANFLEDIVPFALPLLFLFWTSGDISSGFKVKVDPLPGYNGFFRFTSGATPADLLIAIMAAEPF